MVERDLEAERAWVRGGVGSAAAATRQMWAVGRLVHWLQGYVTTVPVVT